jgi:hypothetical protein
MTDEIHIAFALYSRRIGFAKVLNEQGGTSATAGRAEGTEDDGGAQSAARKPDDDVIEGEFKVKK